MSPNGIGDKPVTERLQRVANSASFAKVCAQLAPSRPLYVGGLYGSSAACLAAVVATGRPQPTLIVAPSIDTAEALYSDLSFFTDGHCLLFSAWETAPDSDALPDPEIFSERFEVIRSLVFGNPTVIVTSVQALAQPVVDPTRVRLGLLNLSVGEKRDRDDILTWLVEQGFEREPMVEMPGEFSARGGIIDVYPYSEERPWRIELDGDRIASIRSFDPGTQISTGPCDTLRISAVSRQDFFRAADGPNDTLLLDHLAQGQSVVVLHELADEKSEALLEPLLERINQFPQLYTGSLPFVEELGPINLEVKSIQRFVADFAGVLDSLLRLAQTEPDVFIACHNEGEAHRLNFFATKAGVEEGINFHRRTGHLSVGFELPEAGVLYIGYQELFNRYRQTRQARRYKHSRPLEDLTELKPGDLVVHAQHGIGRYLGMEEIRKDSHVQEYLAIEYRSRAKLLVPAINVENVGKYIGAGDHTPELSKLGGKDWKRRKVLAETATASLAKEFLRMQAVRTTRRGIAYPPDDAMQTEFESSFIYEETPDQITVTAELQADMLAAKPMDRLICGDVGYGKTELAIRAAFRAVNAGRQVAVLVPTTILAQQHYETFSDRVADYPIHVGVISRFRTRTEQREILARAEAGTLDILIGTHRIVQKDVRFRNLGLVIIDEEQRFGVEHKERLKELRATVDVLTLTATPIPRTLHQALLGVRDISRLETPPADRMAIETRVCRWDTRLIRKAFLRELDRNGQIFFVNNRVYNIQSVATALAKIVPECTYGIVHGQMPEHLIEERMVQFTEKQFDVLVATTIIESGLDIPNVNTIFINRADRFGLADLHQLRGRVGRYKHKAYAYLLLPRDGTITADSERRLKAIEEFNQLGAGYQIALRDLEIRGAGNLLGRNQSGHIHAIGYNLYCRLLKMAAARLQAGDEPMALDEVCLDLEVDAYLPDAYVGEIRQKIAMYRQVSSISREEEVAQIEAGLTDRFGPPPIEVRRLLDQARLRLLARSKGVVDLTGRDHRLYIQFRNATLAERVLGHCTERIQMMDNGVVCVTVPPAARAPEALLAFVKNLLQPSERTGTMPLAQQTKTT